MNIRWQDWVNVSLGFWLLASPWGIGYSLNDVATEKALALGMVLALFNLINVCRLIDEGQDVFNIMLGVWLITSPYTLNFSTDQVPMVNAIVVGSMIITFAAWQMYDASKMEK
jgi:hypothetical protein